MNMYGNIIGMIILILLVLSGCICLNESTYIYRITIHIDRANYNYLSMSHINMSENIDLNDTQFFLLIRINSTRRQVMYTGHVNNSKLIFEAEESLFIYRPQNKTYPVFIRFIMLYLSLIHI